MLDALPHNAWLGLKGKGWLESILIHLGARLGHVGKGWLVGKVGAVHIYTVLVDHLIGKGWLVGKEWLIKGKVNWFATDYKCVDLNMKMLCFCRYPCLVPVPGNIIWTLPHLMWSECTLQCKQGTPGNLLYRWVAIYIYTWGTVDM